MSTIPQMGQLGRLLLLQRVVVFCFAAISLHAAPTEDFIVNLPLVGTTLTPQYSGYLDATSGCNTSVNGDYCKIHYWLAMAEGDDPTNKPLVLWLNGGPGSSSILGFLTELGPYLMNATGGLMENPYAWTKLANVVVFESPIGVGYSYCATQLNGGICENTDKYTAAASLAALVDFFLKFPEFQDTDFFITGESYAGVYVPTLAYEIINYNAQDPEIVIPLKGVAVGDPCTANREQSDSMDPLWYGHKYGLVDDAIFDVLWNRCNLRLPNRFLLILHNNDNIATDLHQSVHDTLRDDPTCTLAFRKFMLSTSHALSKEWLNQFIDDYSLFDPVSFDENNAMATYMNRHDVKTALHVNQELGGEWPHPAGVFSFTREFDACNPDPSDPRSMIDFYRKIAPALKATWVYNGDTDPAVSYEGTRQAIKAVGFPELDGGGYRPWFYNHSATTVEILLEKAVKFGPDLLLQDSGPQFGGEIVNYEHNLAFLTFHGSGHMVPQCRPQAALHMLDRFIHYQPLSPLLPKNATLLTMVDDEFEAMINEWTSFAKTMPTNQQGSQAQQA